MTSTECLEDYLIPYSDGRVINLARLRALSFCPSHQYTILDALRALAATDPATATATLNHFLHRIAASVAKPAPTRSTNMTPAQKRRYNERWTCESLLEGLIPLVRKLHDEETVAALTDACRATTQRAWVAAAYGLLNIDVAPPAGRLNALCRWYENSGYREPGAHLSVPTSRYRSVQHKVAMEWERACEALAEALYGELLVARRGETTLSNGLKPDFILASRTIKRDDAGTICFADSIIDAKSGRIPEARYDGYCKHLEFWCRGHCPYYPRKSRGTQIHTYGAAMLADMAATVGRADLAAELSRLAGHEGEVRWRFLDTFRH